MQRTPSVVLFDAACERVYTSGKRMSPTALKKLKRDPIKMRNAAIISLTVTLNDYTSFDKSGKGNRSYE